MSALLAIVVVLAIVAAYRMGAASERVRQGLSRTSPPSSRPWSGR